MFCTPVFASAHPKLRFPIYILSVYSLLLLSGCTYTRPVSTSKPLFPIPDSTYLTLETLLRAEAEVWKGTPHTLGGTSKEGIDCSALVQQVYVDLFDVHLPRTTILQSKEGKTVALGDIAAGDLVFYRINAGTRHVGIYLGQNEFMHASSSQGVTLSNLDSAYWSKRFWTVKRIIKPESDQSEEDLKTSTPQRSKVRW